MKIFEDENDFILGPVIFGTFLKKWNKKKSGILQQLRDKIEEEPALASDIQESLEVTQATIDSFKEAMLAYAAAAKAAKVEYDKSKGTAGKVKNFFGMERGGQDDKVFKLENKKFKIEQNGAYSIRDILSMDFNIGLFLDVPLSGQDLKNKVKNLLSYRKYLEKDKEDKLSDEKKAEYERADADKLDGMIFNTLGFSLDETLIREEDTETPQGYKDLVAKFKVLYDKKQLEFKTALKRAASQQEIKKLAFKLFNDPEYSFYLFLIKAKDEVSAEEWSAFKNLSGPDAYFKEVAYLINKFRKEVYPKVKSIKFTESKMFAKENLKRFFSPATSQEKANQKDADTQEMNALKKRFEAAVKKRIKELQKGIPMFIAGAEDELSGDKEAAKLDPVYAENESFVTKLKTKNTVKQEVFDFAMAYSNTSTITDEQYNEIVGKGNVKLNMETYLGTLDELIEARDKEARRDLTALAAYMEKPPTELEKTKITSMSKTAEKITATLERNNNDTILTVYKKWHDWMVSNKTWMLKYFEENDGVLEEPPDNDTFFTGLNNSLEEDNKLNADDIDALKLLQSILPLQESLGEEHPDIYNLIKEKITKPSQLEAIKVALNKLASNEKVLKAFKDKLNLEPKGEQEKSSKTDRSEVIKKLNEFASPTPLKFNGVSNVPEKVQADFVYFKFTSTEGELIHGTGYEWWKEKKEFFVKTAREYVNKNYIDNKADEVIFVLFNDYEDFEKADNIKWYVVEPKNLLNRITKFEETEDEEEPEDPNRVNLEYPDLKHKVTTEEEAALSLLGPPTEDPTPSGETRNLQENDSEFKNEIKILDKTNFRSLTDEQQKTIASVLQKVYNAGGLKDLKNVLDHFMPSAEELEPSDNKKLGTSFIRYRIQQEYFPKYKPFFDKLQEDPPLFKVETREEKRTQHGKEITRQVPDKILGFNKPFNNRNSKVKDFIRQGIGMNNKSTFFAIVTAMVKNNKNNWKEAFDKVRVLFRKEGSPHSALEAIEKYLKTLEELSEPKNQDIKDPQKANADLEENLKEQIIKLIKPLLREKLKRKINGKKNICN